MLFATQQIELGAVEASRLYDKLSTKSIIESGFKCSNTLEDVLVAIERLHQIGRCGFLLLVCAIHLHNE